MQEPRIYLYVLLATITLTCGVILTAAGDDPEVAGEARLDDTAGKTRLDVTAGKARLDDTARKTRLDAAAGEARLDDADSQGPQLDQGPLRFRLVEMDSQAPRFDDGLSLFRLIETDSQLPRFDHRPSPFRLISMDPHSDHRNWLSRPVEADWQVPASDHGLSSLRLVNFDQVGSRGTDVIEVAGLLLFQPQPIRIPLVRYFDELNVRRTGLFGHEGVRKDFLTRSRDRSSRQRARKLLGAATNAVLGRSARARAAPDSSGLLGRSPSMLGLGTQKRNSIVHDSRIRGARPGQSGASGSYWVPARIDLDTMLSKIDSRLIDNILVIKGPYSARHGPGFNVIDVELLGSPRFNQGPELHASTGLDYKTNGQQWYGRQTLWGGDENYGFRVGYGHRTGSDYQSGSGLRIPSSYKSRDLDLAVGVDLTADSVLEFHLLRLDQTDVEFPGQAFDIDYLVTDAYEFHYVEVDQDGYDRLEVEGWYNRTRFEGSAQRSGKRRQFPFFDAIGYEGFTDVNSSSSGYRGATTWGDDDDDSQLITGVDLRHLRQELNEFSSGEIEGGSPGPLVFSNANSPIPRSRSSDSGLFAEHRLTVDDSLELQSGVRGDVVFANIHDNPAKLEALGLATPQSSLADILGTNDFGRQFQLWSAFATARWELDEDWTLIVGGGHAQRPPSLTELYAAQTFLFLLQNGQNAVTGDPELDAERLWQVDLGIELDRGSLRVGWTGFHAWIEDYITFENTRVYQPPGSTQVEQINLQYVNTDLATLAGTESYVEWDVDDGITTFVNLAYVRGRDRTRNGSFASQPAQPGLPKQEVTGLPRGFFSGVPGADKEALPAIVPLQARVGFRLHPAADDPDWGIELYARINMRQKRIATSLLESPTPGFTLWNIRSFWHPAEGLMLVAGVENFTNRNYREHLDFRSPGGQSVFQPGVNFYLGTEWSY